MRAAMTAMITRAVVQGIFASTTIIGCAALLIDNSEQIASIMCCIQRLDMPGPRKVCEHNEEYEYFDDRPAHDSTRYPGGTKFSTASTAILCTPVSINERWFNRPSYRRYAFDLSRGRDFHKALVEPLHRNPLNACYIGHRVASFDDLLDRVFLKLVGKSTVCLDAVAGPYRLKSRCVYRFGEDPLLYHVGGTLDHHFGMAVTKRFAKDQWPPHAHQSREETTRSSLPTHSTWTRMATSERTVCASCMRFLMTSAKRFRSSTKPRFGAARMLGAARTHMVHKSALRKLNLLAGFVAKPMIISIRCAPGVHTFGCLIALSAPQTRKNSYTTTARWRLSDTITVVDPDGHSTPPGDVHCPKSRTSGSSAKRSCAVLKVT